MSKEPTMINSTIPAKGFGAVTAIALVLAMAATGAGHAEYRVAGHPAYVNAVPRPPMRPLSTGTVVAGPAAQAQPRIAPPAAPVAADRAGDQGRDRNAFTAGVTTGVIVVGVPSGYYYGPATYYAPGYYGDQYTDGGPAVGPSPLPDNGTADCSQTFAIYDPQSGTYIGDDGKEHPCP
jgi:hypothetical protein